MQHFLRNQLLKQYTDFITGSMLLPRERYNSSVLILILYIDINVERSCWIYLYLVHVIPVNEFELLMNTV